MGKQISNLRYVRNIRLMDQSGIRTNLSVMINVFHSSTPPPTTAKKEIKRPFTLPPAAIKLLRAQLLHSFALLNSIVSLWHFRAPVS